ncbi:amidase [Mumia sp. Pv 4-285]|uniref:amidase n=1 Tax=Mumia qirimensis TaxID=3234852 RepID=UPI00351D994C
MDPFSSASDIARSIRAGAISPVDVVELYLSRIDTYNDAVNAIVWRNDDDVRQAAKAAEAALGSGGALPFFHGVPMPIKDLVSVSGQPNTRGGLGTSTEPQPENDLVVDRILNAGFLLMGRTNSPEGGMTQVTENSRYGITRNPWNLDRTPAGSSGGASAAVAAGLAPIASASDGGGSIRMPASATGLVGLKPSRARVPAKVLGWEHGTTQGVVTRTVEDAARTLDYLSVEDPLGWYRAPTPERPYGDSYTEAAGPLRIGLMLDAPNGVEVDPICAETAERTARLLEVAGHTVVPVSADFISTEALRIYSTTVIAASLHTVPYDDPSQSEPFIIARRKMAEELPASEYAKAVLRLHLECRRMVAHWRRDFDVLVSPTLACQVPPVGVILAEANELLDGSSPREARMLAFNSYANILGLPAISVPVGTDSDGLPVGAQLVGSPYDETTILRLAQSLERELDWASRTPAAFTH